MGFSGDDSLPSQIRGKTDETNGVEGHFESDPVGYPTHKTVGPGNQEENGLHPSLFPPRAGHPQRVFRECTKKSKMRNTVGPESS